MKKPPEPLLRQDWYVDQHGYEILEWMEADRGAGPKIPVRYIRGQGGPFREYSVFSDALPIHRELAEVKDDNDAIAFCGKFGLLEETPPPVMPRGKTPSGDHKVNVLRMRGNIVAPYETLSVERFWSHQVRVKGAIESLDNGEKEWAIRSFNMAGVDVVTQINFRKERLDQHWHLVPKNLISAIWLLVEREITGGTNWRQCKNCKDWFMPRTARAEYCKNPCKQAWHRKQRRDKTDG